MCSLPYPSFLVLNKTSSESKEKNELVVFPNLPRQKFVCRFAGG
jgi:hypothetical protein